MSASELALPEPARDARAVGEAADRRRLALLRAIASAGGVVSPRADPRAPHGYTHDLPGADVDRDLAFLARRGYVEARFFDRVKVCPKCDGHHLNVREICPGCRRAHLVAEGLIHHFRCGYVGIPAEFATGGDGGYLCPKCNHRMHHLGSEFDRLGRAFTCHGCGLISENPPVEAVCLGCGARTPGDNTISVVVFAHEITSRGAAALRAGALLADEDDDAAEIVAEAPAMRRAVTVEFLGHEFRRARHARLTLSVLLAACAPDALDRGGEDAPARWLVRLRACLRDIDVVGRLAEALYVVILPQFKPREAEALCRRVGESLGPASPFTLSSVTLAEPRDLTRLIAGRNALGA